MRMQPDKVVSALPDVEDFKEWEWGDDDLTPFLNHIRVDTAKVITDQIAENCVARISETTGQFVLWPYGIDCEFVVKFDILKALAEGQIEFDDLDELKSFTAKIDGISANLHNAIKVAEKQS